MSDAASTDAGSTTATGEGGTGAGTQTPEGFVSQADFEREQARARSFQAEADRAKAALAAAQATPAPAKDEGGEGTAPSFDPAAFRDSLLRDTQNVIALTTAAANLKGQFPLADEAIYGRLSEFGSADALRLAVEDSHNRVAALVAKEKEAIEAKLREEFGKTIGGGGEGAGAGVPAGDPTIEQLAAMSVSELAALEAKSPGVTERVLRSA